MTWPVAFVLAVGIICLTIGFSEILHHDSKSNGRIE
jgi:hypothetical protein